MTRRLTLALLLLAASSAAWAQRQPLNSPVYYLVTAAELVEGAPLHGELTPASGQNFKDGSYLDVYVLRTAGQETLEVRVESDDFDTFLSLFAPDGTLVEANDEVRPVGGAFASRVRAWAPAAGTYLVVVSGYGPADLGRYTVSRDRYLPPPKVVVDLDVPGRYDGYLNEEMADMIWITLDAPATLVATLRSAAFDTVLEIYDGAGSFVDANDDFDGTDSRLVLDLEAGRYEFLVKAYSVTEAGAYGFDVDFYEAPPVVEVEVTTPGAFEGFLAPEAVDVYLLTLSAPAEVTVDLRSSAFDTFLEASDADGLWIDSNDDHDGTDSRLFLRLEAGTYRFTASGYWSGDSGPYTIEFAW